jgi:hypothetical protein
LLVPTFRQSLELLFYSVISSIAWAFTNFQIGASNDIDRTFLISFITTTISGIIAMAYFFLIGHKFTGIKSAIDILTAIILFFLSLVLDLYLLPSIDVTIIMTYFLFVTFIICRRTFESDDEKI